MLPGSNCCQLRRCPRTLSLQQTVRLCKQPPLQSLRAAIPAKSSICKCLPAAAAALCAPAALALARSSSSSSQHQALLERPRLQTMSMMNPMLGSSPARLRLERAGRGGAVAISAPGERASIAAGQTGNRHGSMPAQGTCWSACTCPRAGRRGSTSCGQHGRVSRERLLPPSMRLCVCGWTAQRAAWQRQAQRARICGSPGGKARLLVGAGKGGGEENRLGRCKGQQTLGIAGIAAP